MTIFAPNRKDPITTGNGIQSIRFADVLESLVNTVNTLVENTAEYTLTNVTTDRTFDADAAAGDISSPPTQAEVEKIRDAQLETANVVGTLIEDLQNAGVIQ